MKNIQIDSNPQSILTICGPNDSHLRFIEKNLNVELYTKNEKISIKGDGQDVEYAAFFISELQNIVNHKGNVDSKDLKTILNLIAQDASKNQNHNMVAENSNILLITKSQADIRPHNAVQVNMWKAVKENDIVFSIGPAGTGKTYMAVAIAVDAFLNNMVSKIVLARPAVEAGESLGFLPGDFKEKIDPYLRPLYDSLSEMFPKDILKRLIDEETIEVIPLAYMRGRTLNNAFVILDEAQNSTLMQMKMFLTRMGRNTKVIITGDVTQIDLSDSSKSGLIHVQRVLRNIKGISFVFALKTDVIRHRLVQDIIEAYEGDLKEKEEM